ncbi:hypothetical protein P5673_033601 [Acropora cervicornis]|uniref:Uncharacterized protein n=1 Tax=Acropora cervicornis TaxID=6130 RepID=A0AAD9UR57_ACRCE|nr:hypothetical protein P5673_033601 [Acropora cervicornis]
MEDKTAPDNSVVFEEQAVILISHLEKRIDKGVFDIMPFISRCALEVICALVSKEDLTILDLEQK